MGGGGGGTRLHSLQVKMWQCHVTISMYTRPRIDIAIRAFSNRRKFQHTIAWRAQVSGRWLILSGQLLQCPDGYIIASGCVDGGGGVLENHYPINGFKLCMIVDYMDCDLDPAY